ncbi:3-hydroxyacyl-ACP dehydratase FabZ family protein [Flagellimonas sp.]|uniref:3-hydroxyacyl-ACP dehydratase FabZ family protein n=1 Tax=Flagellimonas sp. TaxID=2058762 RepID=UPI003F4A3956
MEKTEILSKLPYSKPFLFVDELTYVHSEGVVGNFSFRKDLDFYQGHFKDEPITPGVILTECCAQIGVVCLGIFLLGEEMNDNKLQIGMSSSEMEFYIPILPGETVRVESEKLYFRFGKLKCKVKLYNQKGELACKGVLAGMFKSGRDGK